MRSGQPVRILVVDDAASDRHFVREILAIRPEWTIDEATDGRHALERIEAHAPDLVLTDMQMPVMDGLELLATIKQQHPQTPVVVMTAQGSEEAVVRALRAGADSYVPKRIMHDELAEIVQRILSIYETDAAYKRLIGHLTFQQSEFELPNDLTLIASLVNLFRQAMEWLGICEDREQYRVAVALEEALLNALYHGNLEVSSKLRETDHRQFAALAEQRKNQYPYCERRIRVAVSFQPEEARFVVRDEGPGFDPQALPDPTDPENLSKPCGRGVLLMRAFMDEVTFNDRGNEVTMVKRKCSPDVPGGHFRATGA